MSFPSLSLNVDSAKSKMASETTPLRSDNNAADQSYGSTPTAVSISSQEEEGQEQIALKDGVEDGSLPRVQLTRKEFWCMLLGLFMTVCKCAPGCGSKRVGEQREEGGRRARAQTLEGRKKRC